MEWVPSSFSKLLCQGRLRSSLLGSVPSRVGVPGALRLTVAQSHLGDSVPWGRLLGKGNGGAPDGTGDRVPSLDWSDRPGYEWTPSRTDSETPILNLGRRRSPSWRDGCRSGWRDGLPGPCPTQRFMGDRTRGSWGGVLVLTGFPDSTTSFSVSSFHPDLSSTGVGRRETGWATRSPGSSSPSRTLSGPKGCMLPGFHGTLGLSEGDPKSVGAGVQSGASGVPWEPRPTSKGVGVVRGPGRPPTRVGLEVPGLGGPDQRAGATAKRLEKELYSLARYPSTVRQQSVP